ncbi:hypothetical protein GCM10022393_19360 [Aquimarina addita]|uniref:Uncharacterized protein n=1 Tax=Aquimarina addita TaxID=870485 RepID=A0ABP6UHL7_9FLAO
MSIAKDNNLNAEELKAYHNSRVEIYEQIENRLPFTLQFVVLPPDGYILENGKEVWGNKDEPEPETVITQFYGKLDRETPENELIYGVLKTIQSGEKETIIKYKVSVRFYPENEETYNYVTVNLISKIFINDQVADLIADQMAVDCIESIYPVILKIDRNGLLEDVVNHEDILQRWEKQKKKKLQYYQGRIAIAYFKLFEQTLQEKELFFSYLQKDWFFKAFFHNIYSVYRDNDIDNYIDFSIIPNTKDVEYNVAKVANKVLKNNRMRIEIKGKCSDARNKTELTNGAYFHIEDNKQKKPVKGTFRAIYFLSPKTHKIDSLYMSCNLKLDEYKSGTITISEITDTTLEKNHQSLFLEEDTNGENEDKKSSFWKRIFS